VKIYLLRHAKASKRRLWEGPDELRPLSNLGRRQALGLIELLAGKPLERIISSPYRRCRESVDPLGAARALRVELDGRLGEGQRASKALELIDSLGDEPALLCSHGDLIPALLCELEARGVAIEGNPRSEKGSLWVLEGSPRGRLRATYVPPPRAPKDAIDEPKARRNARLAVLDLGSTSFHLMIADVSSDGELERVTNDRVMLRLGAVILRDGSVPEDVCVRAVDTARKLARIAQRHGAELVFPVATAALREATNGPELADAIAEAVGAPVRILSGEEEARLMFAAFRTLEGVVGDANLGLDLGGGSLELAIGSDRFIAWEATLRLGAARVHSEIVRSDPMSAGEARALQDLVHSRLEPHLSALRSRAPASCIATGGSVRALARLAARRRRRKDSSDAASFSLDELRALRGDLVSADHEERLRMPGISRSRADLLPCAALVIEGVASALGLGRVRVSEWGLREGVLLEAIGLACSARVGA
jgi:exopolyphosphatase/guanosine-5'-triphosphate,3'-diphosphate pyrophosphatase